MPDTNMPLELQDYARDLFCSPDPMLQALTEAAKRFGMPEGWEISPDVGRLFQVLCRAIGAKKILEFGTLAGHSAFWFARALPAEGQVISVEVNPDYAAFASKHLEQMGLKHKVQVRLGACREMLPILEREAPYDVLFLDADKAHYPEFLDWSVRVLRPGGLLLADNVLRSGSWNNQQLLDPASFPPLRSGVKADASPSIGLFWSTFVVPP